MNPYFIILSLFCIGGLFVMLWGLLIILKAQKSKQWPSVNGFIEGSKSSSEENDLFPHIQYRYSVGDITYHRTVEFPGDISPTEEFSASYVRRYPVGTKVQVFYKPTNPEEATLEPGLGKGDWLVFVIGLGTLMMGMFFLLFGG